MTIHTARCLEFLSSYWSTVPPCRTTQLCRPQVIYAYPITAQTHTVEGLGELVKAGELTGYSLVEDPLAGSRLAAGMVEEQG